MQTKKKFVKNSHDVELVGKIRKGDGEKSYLLETEKNPENEKGFVTVVPVDPYFESGGKEKQKPTKRERVLCIDILRGVAVILMVIVNATPLGRGDSFYILRHSTFEESITIIDIGFPIFLFIIGYTSNLVTDRKIDDKSNSENRISLFGIKKFSFKVKMKRENFIFINKWFKIVRRSLILYLLGVYRCSLFALVFVENNMVFGVPDLIPFYVGALFASVLQRIAICYFVVTVILNMFDWTISQIIVNMIIHMIYILLMHGSGRSGIISEECNAQTYFDGLILDFPKGEAAEYGIVTTLTSINTTYIGCLFYKIYKSVNEKWENRVFSKMNSPDFTDEMKIHFEKTKKYEIIAKWSVFSFSFLLMGWFFNYFVYKISKVMWSTAFVCFTGGTSGLILSMIFYVVDILNYRKIVYLLHAVGVNSLFMYIVPLTILGLSLLRVGHGFENSNTISGYIAYYCFFTWMQDEKWANLMFGICFELIFIPLAIFFHYKKIYFKV